VRLRRAGEGAITVPADAGRARGPYARRVKRKPDVLFDVAPVAVTLLDGILTIVRGHPHTDPELVGPALLAAAAALTLGARAPVAVLTFLLALALAVYGGPTMLLPALFALFAVARLRDRPTLVGATLVSAAVFPLSRVLHSVTVPLPSLIPEWVAICLAVAAGLYVRARAEQLTGLALQAAAEERVRIARELHDVVAHHVSMMGVQAGAARVVIDRDRVKAKESLTAIEVSSRQAVGELHRLLGFLRQAGDEDDLAPRPGLSQLPRLAASMSESGLAVALSIEGDERSLPPMIGVSAYRIVQEALTNTLKHAAASHADVRVRYWPAELEVEIIDDGHGATALSGTSPGGLGLIGMRERAALHGGKLTAAPVSGGGFAVSVKLPTPDGVP